MLDKSKRRSDRVETEEKRVSLTEVDTYSAGGMAGKDCHLFWSEN